ncbi:pyruvate carboxylase [Aureococcus anophagefferens]|nr:pyruvate carboxylase [Aureococcus anophagefferens]
MSGLTSQPSLGAIAAATDTSLDSAAYSKISSYWDTVRATPRPLESGQLATASDVKVHEIPGGQYTNLLFQSRQLGLDGRFDDVKAKYAMANRILGDIPKVTPSSKVVGDLAQFMVAQNLMEADVGLTENVARLPDSVVDYLKGSLGTPPGGFPEPLRTDALAAKNLEPLQGRPGASLGAYDFEEAREMLKEKYADATKQITFEDVLSHALYPAVFSDYMDHRLVYGDVDHLPTHVFLRPMKVNDEVSFDDARGRKYFIKLVAKSTPDESGRGIWPSRRRAADQVGAPMPGVVVAVNVKEGDVVKKGETLFVLSAMKMESTIVAPQDGTVDSILINSGDSVEAEDLSRPSTERALPPRAPRSYARRLAANSSPCYHGTSLDGGARSNSGARRAALTAAGSYATRLKRYVASASAVQSGRENAAGYLSMESNNAETAASTEKAPAAREKRRPSMRGSVASGKGAAAETAAQKEKRSARAA